MIWPVLADLSTVNIADIYKTKRVKLKPMLQCHSIWNIFYLWVVQCFMMLLQKFNSIIMRPTMMWIIWVEFLCICISFQILPFLRVSFFFLRLWYIIFFIGWFKYFYIHILKSIINYKVIKILYNWFFYINLYQ